MNRCECGKFCGQNADSYTPFGCSSYDPPEPYDEIMLCPSCSKKMKSKFLKHFASGGHTSDWQKSRAEVEAAKESGLVWVHGFKPITINGKSVSYQYVTSEEFNNGKTSTTTKTKGGL